MNKNYIIIDSVGTSGCSGLNGTSGTSGSGISGSSGTSGVGSPGTSGSSGKDGLNGGVDGSSGTSGIGISGSSGTSGGSGNNGSSGTSGIGISGSSGTSGKNGSSGTSGNGLQQRLSQCNFSSNLAIDFSLFEVFVDSGTTLSTGNWTYTITNPTFDKVITLSIPAVGSATVTLPNTVKILQGSFLDDRNYVYIHCIDSSTPTYLCAISQEGA